MGAGPNLEATTRVPSMCFPAEDQGLPLPCLATLACHTPAADCPSAGESSMDKMSKLIENVAKAARRSKLLHLKPGCPNPN